MLARQNVYQAYRTILGERLCSSWCWWWTLCGRGASTALKDNQVPSWQVPIPKAQALGNQGQTCQWWGWIHVPVHGEAGICTAPTSHFASHFLLASEGLSCLSARTKKLPAGGGDVGKKKASYFKISQPNFHWTHGVCFLIWKHWSKNRCLPQKGNICNMQPV